MVLHPGTGLLLPEVLGSSVEGLVRHSETI